MIEEFISSRLGFVVCMAVAYAVAIGVSLWTEPKIDNLTKPEPGDSATSSWLKCELDELRGWVR